MNRLPAGSRRYTANGASHSGGGVVVSKTTTRAVEKCWVRSLSSAPVQAPGPNAPKPSASGCVWPRPAKSCFGRVLPWTSGGDGATSAGPPMVPHAVLARQFSWLTIYIFSAKSCCATRWLADPPSRHRNGAGRHCGRHG